MPDSGWFKSSYSASGNDQCVEVRIADAAVGVRDIKSREAGALRLTPEAWDAFVGEVSARTP